MLLMRQLSNYHIVLGGLLLLTETDLALFDMFVLLKSGSTKVMFYPSHVLPKSCSTKLCSTKVRIFRNELYQSPVCLKRAILPNSVLATLLSAEGKKTTSGKDSVIGFKVCDVTS
jgi:hypothetical protein